MGQAFADVTVHIRGRADDVCEVGLYEIPAGV